MSFVAFGTAIPVPFSCPHLPAISCRRHRPVTSLRRGIMRPLGSPPPDDGQTSKRRVPGSTELSKSVPEAQARAADVVIKTSRRKIPDVASSTNSATRATETTSTSPAVEDAKSVDDVAVEELARVRMTGFNSPLVISSELADALLDGERVMTRAQAASRISRYARSAGLAVNGTRCFRLDTRLRSLFPHADELVRFQTITGLLSPHVTKPEECDDANLRARARKLRREYAAAAARDSSRARPDRRGQHSAKVQSRMKKLGRGLFTPVRLSPTLQEICGEEEVMSRPEVTKKVWVYIKKHNMQDDADRRLLHLDPLLSNMCGGLKDVNCFELSRYIARHLTPVQSG